MSGGDSPEREVSLRSGLSVVRALREAGVEVFEYDPIDGIDGLIVAAKKFDAVFPILHGLHGEDGTIQEVLEQHNIPYLGTGSVASRVCFDKILTHNALESSGITMPRSIRATTQDIGHELFLKPYVLKPISGGSSIDTQIVRILNEEARKETIRLLAEHTEMLAEELIEGNEITIGILGNNALPPIFIKPPLDMEFDYINKYNGKTQEVCPIPEEILSLAIQEGACQLALRVHELLGCRHLSRVDMIVDSNNELYVLEVNTMPGMTDKSLYPLGAAVYGLTMPELVQLFVGNVIKE
jgi:D-alanine-D-alanine ligase